MYNALNKLSEYKYFYRSKNITSYTFLLVFKIVEILHCLVLLGTVKAFIGYLFFSVLLSFYLFLSNEIYKAKSAIYSALKFVRLTLNHSVCTAFLPVPILVIQTLFPTVS